MICFARSGGTLLNRCLGSLENTVILSEVSPLGGGWGSRGEKSYTTIKEQAYNWWGINIESDDYFDGIVELHKICNEENKHLIIRDWSFINFVPYVNNKLNPPNRLLTFDGLRNYTDIIPFAFVRDSIDIWISRGTPPINKFYQQYLKYIEVLLREGIRIFKFEDFVNDPNKIMSELCIFLNIEYSELFLNFENFNKINGDSFGSDSRGYKRSIIRPLPRKIIKKEKIQEINKCELLVEANRLLNYPTLYDNGSLENRLMKNLRRLKSYLE